MTGSKQNCDAESFEYNGASDRQHNTEREHGHILNQSARLGASGRHQALYVARTEHLNDNERDERQIREDIQPTELSAGDASTVAGERA